MFDVPVEVKLLPSVRPPEEEVAFVVTLASEMPPGGAGVVVGAGLPNVDPNPPKMKTKVYTKQLF